VALLSNYYCVISVRWQWHNKFSVDMPVLQSCSLRVSFGIMPKHSLMLYSRTVWSVKKRLIAFCQHVLEMIWTKFGLNWTSSLGGVLKSRFKKK